MKTALKPVRDLYDWMLALGEKPYALYALAILAFAESIIFPLPLEVLLLPMILGARHRVILFVLVAAMFSALGAVVGSLLAQQIQPFLTSIPGVDSYDIQVVENQFAQYGVWAIALGALTILPFKFTVIAAGIAKYNLFWLFTFSLLFRGLRYALIGVLLFYFGGAAKRFIDRWFGWLCLLGIVLIGLLVWYVTRH